MAITGRFPWSYPLYCRNSARNVAASRLLDRTPVFSTCLLYKGFYFSPGGILLVYKECQRRVFIENPNGVSCMHGEGSGGCETVHPDRRRRGGLPLLRIDSPAQGGVRSGRGGERGRGAVHDPGIPARREENRPPPHRPPDAVPVRVGAPLWDEAIAGRYPRDRHDRVLRRSPPGGPGEERVHRIPGEAVRAA